MDWLVSERRAALAALVVVYAGEDDWVERVACAIGRESLEGPNAMLDRLLHRSVVINLDGESYRLRDHHAAAETLRRATTGTRQPLH